MLLREFLELLNKDMLIKVQHQELSGDNNLYTGISLNCPYWIAEYKLSSNNSEGWTIEDNYLIIQCQD